METPDIARRPTVSKAANEKVVPGAAALMRREPNVQETTRSIATYKYEETDGMADEMETERNAKTATTPDEGRPGGND